MKCVKGSEGFTLIELIMVIVILGILAVAVMGKYQNLQDEAKQAVVDGIAAELSSASKANFAKCLINQAGCTPINHHNLNDVRCDEIADHLLIDKQQLETELGIEFKQVPGSNDCSGGGGTTAKCKVTNGDQSANATIFCTD